jgi:alpha-tubulin suppressor-like RCC1 family protein
LDDSHLPGPVKGLSSGIAAIAGGVNHTCAVTTAGQVKCWGFNSDGQIGNGTGFGNNAHTPVVVKTIRGATAIATGSRHGCAVIRAGNLKCWGQNDGQIGDGTSTERDIPVDVTGF